MMIRVSGGYSAWRVQSGHGSESPRASEHGWAISVVMRMVCEGLELLIIRIVKPLQLLFDGSPLAPAYRATAVMFLLLIHFLKNIVLLDLDERLPLVLFQP